MSLRTAFSNVVPTICAILQIYARLWHTGINSKVCFFKLTNAHFRDAVFVNNSSIDMISHYAYDDELAAKFAVDTTDDVCMAKQLERASLSYKVGQYLVIDYKEMPMFGKVEAFVCMPSESEWYVVVQCLNTVQYDSRFHSYVVENCIPTQFRVVSFAELIDSHPVCGYKKTKRNKIVHFIRLQHHVLPRV